MTKSQFAIPLILGLGLLGFAYAMTLSADENEDVGHAAVDPESPNGLLQFLKKGRVVRVTGEHGGYTVAVVPVDERRLFDSRVLEVTSDYVVLDSRVADPTKSDPDLETVYIRVREIIPEHAIVRIILEQHDLDQSRKEAEDLIRKRFDGASTN